jgi:hypothetical protein
MIEEFERDIGVMIVETISIEKHLTEDERERLEADSLSIYSAPETIRTVQIVERKEKRMPSTAEVALTLGVTKNTVSGLVCQGKLESAGHGQITDESLGKYLANRKANGGGRGRKPHSGPIAKPNIEQKTPDNASDAPRVPSWLKSLITKAYEKGKQDGAMEVVDQMRHLEDISLEEVLA